MHWRKNKKISKIIHLNIMYQKAILNVVIMSSHGYLSFQRIPNIICFGNIFLMFLEITIPAVPN